MQKIYKVAIENFKGMSGVFVLDDLTAISGKNYSGKTTISDAIQLALHGYVPGDFVNRTNQDQFDAYCSNKKGEMSIELFGEDGEYKVTYCKPKDSVRRDCTFNGGDVPSKSLGKDFLNVSVFDAKQYFGKLKAGEQVTELCKYVDVDPNELKKLDEKISEANEKKKEAQKRKLEEERAMEDHVKEMQSIAKSTEDFNPETAEAELKELNEKLQRINRKINESIESESKRQSLTQSLESLKRSNMEKGEELANINIPDEESAEDLEEQLAEMKSIQEVIEHNHTLEKKLNSIRLRTRPETPKTTREEVDQLRMDLIEAQSSSGGPTLRDEVGYEIGKSIFEKMQESPVINEEERNLCLDIVQEACVEFREAMNKPMLNGGKVDEIKREIQRKENELNQYSLVMTEWKNLQTEAKEIESYLMTADKPKYDEDYHSKLLQKKAMLTAQSEEVLRLRKRSERLGQEMATNFELIDKQEKELAALPEESDVDALKKDRESVEALIPALQDGIRSQVRYDTVKELADKKESSVEEWTSQVSKWRHAEERLKGEKAELLSSIQDSLADKADRILAPDRMTFELPKTTKSTDRIRFKLHKANGVVSDRVTASGAEEVEFDLALSHALVGESGFVVVDELNRLDPQNLPSTIKKIMEARDSGKMPQTLLVGHSLTEYVPHDVRVIDMNELRAK